MKCSRVGRYSRFVLTGPYSDLPAATRRVFEIVSQNEMMMRSDFCIENYVTDPQTAPERSWSRRFLFPSHKIPGDLRP